VSEGKEMVREDFELGKKIKTLRKREIVIRRSRQVWTDFLMEWF